MAVDNKLIDTLREACRILEAEYDKQTRPKPTVVFYGIVQGNLPSMKNRRRIVPNKRTGKQALIKSKECMEYEKLFLPEISPYLHEYRRFVPIPVPVQLTAIVTYRSKRSDLDVNYLMDLLQTFGVIANDNQITHITAMKEVDKDAPKVEFMLTTRRDEA
jgi:Holliday junction resolvase RusA-like endonuclease